MTAVLAGRITFLLALGVLLAAIFTTTSPGVLAGAVWLVVGTIPRVARRPHHTPGEHQ